ncbi:hypothetical protein F4814DRAFT_104134 [Daldinia grandis]|nr:hypothetical protein F4814DRAFT_104134 [Daldinia grandis]
MPLQLRWKKGQSGAKAYDKNRKSLEDNRPICFSHFRGIKDAVYCRATCGQNIHRIFRDLDNH